MKKTLISTAVFALLFASCSNDEGLIQPTQSLEGTPIHVNVAVADMQTRAGYDNSNLPDQFYLDVIHPDEDSKYTYHVLMKNEENVWNSKHLDTDETVQMLWAGDDKQVSVTAATFSLAQNTIDLGVEADQLTVGNVKSSDHLLMSTTSVTPSLSGIDVTFNHLMSKIKLVIELGTEFTATENPFTGVSINGTLLKRKFNYTSKSWANIDSEIASTVTLFSNGFIAATDETKATGEFEAILVPQTVASGNFSVTFLVDGRKFKWTSTEAITLESGTEYTLKLTAGHDKVSSASFAASAWNAGNSISGKTE